DLLLVGACHPPGGKPAATCPAVFRVGGSSKTVGVLGNRRWDRRWLASRATDPEPFTRMDLRYENSFGGSDHPANPVGKGFAEVSDASGGKVWPLPNIEDPSRLIERPGSRPQPAGFGPLSRTWAMRRAKLGTYKGAYLKTRWPWFPEDFDWTYFNAAPPDQQLEGYLRGDERLEFENLHPTLARYESRLPGLRIRSFVNRAGGNSSAEALFSEIQMNLDTLWVDMESEKLVLVWRGWTAVSSEEHEEVLDFLVVSEPLTQAPAPVERYRREFIALDAVSAKPFEPEAPQAPPKKAEEADRAARAAESEAGRKRLQEEAQKRLQAQAAALNAHLGLDQLPPEVRRQTLETQAKLIGRLSETDPVKSATDGGKEGLRASLAKLGLDLDHLPPQTEKAQAEQTRFLAELGVSPKNGAADPALAKLGSVIGALFAKAGLPPDNLEPAIAEARKLREKLGLGAEKPAAPEAAKEAVRLTRESVKAKHAKHGSFEGLNLSGLDLSELDLKGADLAGANLAGATLRKTNLGQANVSKANLTGSDLSEANLENGNAAQADFSGAKLRQTILKGTDLTQAKFVKADLSKAVLDGAVLESADLGGACLAGSSAGGALFPRANLTGANFRKALCAKADFSKATLNQADFEGANLAEASVQGATGHNLNLNGAILTKLRASGKSDLAGAKLVQTQGDGSIWREANLTGADLRYAQMEEAMFTSACLKQANLSAANLKFSRFNKASLREAKLLNMNLFQGSLEKADLTLADLSGSNLYEVEFLNAVLDRTTADGTNLKRTKLDSG
ncbi:MAG: DUF2169 family type VI secretion system accessory protein, partial [Opitutaceae bacterium]